MPAIDINTLDAVTLDAIKSYPRFAEQRRIDPKLKRQWVRALCSGKYPQGSAFLRKVLDGVETFCCLGVLADIGIRGRWDDDALRTLTGRYRYNGLLTRIDTTRAMGSAAAERTLGLTRETRELLAHLNDRGWSFEMIAAWIEHWL